MTERDYPFRDPILQPEDDATAEGDRNSGHHHSATVPGRLGCPLST
jgi:hypothetical protein